MTVRLVRTSALWAPTWLVVGFQVLAVTAFDVCSGGSPGASVALPAVVAVLAAAQTAAVAFAGARGRAIAAAAALGVVALAASIVLYGLAAVAPLGCGDWYFQT